MSYSTLESNLVTQLRTLSMYNSGNCKAADMDGVFRYADEQDSGVYRDNIMFIDYGGGRSTGRNIWTHIAHGFLAVRVREYAPFEDINDNFEDVNDSFESDSTIVDAKLRTALDAVRTLLHPNNNNVSVRCALVNISAPYVFSRSGSTWVACDLTIEMDEHTTRC